MAPTIRDFRTIAIAEGSLQEMVDFARERERIRVKKESGEPFPWTEDVILRDAKFCNIFREDDKVSAWMFSRLQGMNNLESLWTHLMIGRLFNRIDHMETLFPIENPQEQIDALVDANMKTSLMNAKAYQFYPTELGKKWGYRDIRTLIREQLVPGVERTWEVVSTLENAEIKETVYTLSKAWGSAGHFWFLQCLLDLAWLTDGVVDPHSEVYAGDGGRQVYALFGMSAEELTPAVNELWHDKKRELFPYDIEQLTCEYRKWKIRTQEGVIPNNRKYKPS